MKFAIFAIILLTLTSITFERRRKLPPLDPKIENLVKFYTNGDHSSSISSKSSHSTKTERRNTSHSSRIRVSSQQTSNVLNPEYDSTGTNKWAVEGVTGYDSCSFQGETALWKENKGEWYRFTVFQGFVKEVGKSSDKSVPVKSFKVPKGFKLEYKGMLLRNKFEVPLNSEQKAELSGFRDGSFAKTVETYTDETCAINMNYWYMNMKVTALEYVKIAIRIPSFLRIAIECQKLQIKKFEIQKKIEQSVFNCKSNLENLRTMESEYIKYKKTVEEYKIKIQEYIVKIENFRKIISGQITIDQFSEESKLLIQKNKELENEIRNLEIKITEINNQIKEITSNRSKYQMEINNYEFEIKSQQSSSFSIKTEITKISVEINGYESQILKINSEASQKRQKISNSKSSLQIKNEELKRIQEEIRKMEKEIIEEENSYKILINSLTEVDKKKTTLTLKITQIETSRTKNESRITELRKKITQINKIIRTEQTKESRLREEEMRLSRLILEYKSQIDTNISLGRRQTIDFYKKEELTFSKQIEEYKLKLVEIEKIISTQEIKINKIKVTVQNNHNCEGSSSKEITEIETQYRNQIRLLDNEYVEIINIFSEQSEYLNSIKNSFNAQTSIENWIVSTKQTITKYLQLVPSNTAPLMEMARRRRRRFRRMKRRMF